MAEFVIGGKVCAKMFDDFTIAFENGETFSLQEKGETVLRYIGVRNDNLPQPTAVRDPSSGELTITIFDENFRVVPGSHLWSDFGSKILRGEEFVGTFWPPNPPSNAYLDFYIDLSERDMVLLTVLASEASFLNETPMDNGL